VDGDLGYNGAKAGNEAQGGAENNVNTRNRGKKGVGGQREG